MRSRAWQKIANDTTCKANRHKDSFFGYVSETFIVKEDGRNRSSTTKILTCCLNIFILDSGVKDPKLIRIVPILPSSSPLFPRDNSWTFHVS